MPSSSAITQVARYRVEMPSRYLSLLVPTHDAVRIRGTRYQRFTFRGVPGREVDVIVAEAVLEHRDDASIVLDVSDMRPHQLPPSLTDIVMEIGEKAGRYDGQIRRRYALRQFSDRTQLDQIQRADLRIVQDLDDSSGELIVTIRPRDGGAPIADAFRILKTNLEGYDMYRICMWHRERYFRHLGYADAEQAAKEWEQEVTLTGEAASWTLAEANRSASRRMYRLSRQLGWRKLSSRERATLQLPADSGQWQREEWLMPYYERAGIAPPYSGTGCGEFTLREACGVHYTEPHELDPPTTAELIELEFEDVA